MNLLLLCDALSQTSLTMWQDLTIDIEEIYTILNYQTFESFKTRICSIEMMEDVFLRLEPSLQEK